jgi:hypothetical protein
MLKQQNCFGPLALSEVECRFGGATFERSTNPLSFF